MAEVRGVSMGAMLGGAYSPGSVTTRLDMTPGNKLKFVGHAGFSKS